MTKQALEWATQCSELLIFFAGILQLRVNEGEQFLALGLIGDALNHIRWFHDKVEVEACVLAEATFVAEKGIKLLIVYVAAMPALVGIVTAVLADAMLVGNRA